jgi:hypothetical protein
MVIAHAEPGGVVISGDEKDMRRLSDGARGVRVIAV